MNNHHSTINIPFVGWNNDSSLSDDNPIDATVAPLLVTVTHAQLLLGIGKTKIFQMLNHGILERRKVGRATRVTMASIRRLAGI